MGPAQWVFTVPKLLRPDFMHHLAGATTIPFDPGAMEAVYEIACGYRPARR